MGVTHKLKKPIVDYILELKRNQPALSCRKIADQVTEAFQVKISKSSVSIVLKNSDLSSSVGRRHRKPPDNMPTFSIPPEKKQEILKNLMSANKDPAAASGFPAASPSPATGPSVSPEKPTKESLQKELSKLRGAASNQPAGEGGNTTQQEPSVGSVMALSVLWYQLGSGWFGAWLAQQLGDHPGNGLEANCDVMLARRMVGMDPGPPLTDYCTEVVRQEELKCFLMRDLPDLTAVYAKQEMVRKMSRVTAIEVRMSSTVLRLIPAFCGESEEESALLIWPLERVVEEVIDRIIMNIQPWIVVTSNAAGSPDDDSVAGFSSLWKRLTSERIQQITLFDQRGRRCWEYKSVPSFTRQVLLAVTPDRQGEVSISGQKTEESVKDTESPPSANPSEAIQEVPVHNEPCIIHVREGEGVQVLFSPGSLTREQAKKELRGKGLVFKVEKLPVVVRDLSQEEEWEQAFDHELQKQPLHGLGIMEAFAQALAVQWEQVLGISLKALASSISGTCQRRGQDWTISIVPSSSFPFSVIKRVASVGRKDAVIRFEKRIS